MKVVALAGVHAYLEDLVHLLYQKEYFGFEEAARRYVVELFDDIKKNLPIRAHKPAPKYFDRYGKSMKYAVFKKNRHTCWYAFFKTYHSNGEKVYLVRYITNNHVAAHLL